MPADEQTMLAGLGLLKGSKFWKIRSEGMLRKAVPSKPKSSPAPDRIIGQRIIGTLKTIKTLQAKQSTMVGIRRTVKKKKASKKKGP